MAAPTKNAAAFWGSTFEEFAHLGTIPFNADYYPTVERQGAVGTSTLHQAVSLSTVGIPAPFTGKTKAMRITMPPSGGATSRYQLSRFWRNVAPGDDYWVSWWDYIGADWNITSGQLTNNGTTFTAVGHTNRNATTGANGPLCYNADFTFRNGVAQRQAGLNLVGTTAQNGDGALQKGIVGDVIKQVWTFWEAHYIWSRGSSGRVEFYRDGALVHTITGQNVQSTENAIQLRLGFYQGPGINHTRTLYVASHMVGPTRASVAVGVGSSPPPPPQDYTPQNFTATWNAGTSKIDLAWTATTDPAFSYYAIRYSTDPNLPQDQWTRINTGGPANNGNFTTNSASFTPPTPGATYSFYVAEVNTSLVPSGRSSVATATAGGTDTTAPTTTITAPTVGQTVTTNTPSVTWSATEAATFEGRVDGAAAWTTGITSPWVLLPLTNGSHTVEIRGTDAAGNVESPPASRTFTVNVSGGDVTPPVTTITSPSNGAALNTSRPVVSFAANEAATFTGSVDGGAFISVASPWTLPTLGNGTHSVTVRATDLAGNTETAPPTVTFTVSVVDTTPPVVTITSPPDGGTLTNASPVIEWTANEPATFQARLDGGPLQTLGSATVWNPGALANGSHTVEILATDTAGNRNDSGPARVTFTISAAATTNVERLVLNGLDLNPGGTTYMLKELDVSPPAQKQEWVSSADSENAVLTRDPQYENRVVRATIELQPQGSKDTALALIAAISSHLREASQSDNGVPLEWTPLGATQAMTFTVLSGQVTDLPVTYEAVFGNVLSCTLEMTCHPFATGEETTGGVVVSSDPLTELQVQVDGDVPALGRLIVTDLANQARRHVEFGVESSNAGTITTPVLIDSAALTLSGFSGVRVALANAYGTGQNAVGASVAGIPTAVCGTGTLSHTGQYRVKARVRLSSATTRVRFTWAAGDGPLVSNEWTTPGTGFREADLGTVNIASADTGTQAWRGQIDTVDTTSTVGETIGVDFLMLIPVTDGWGKARGEFREPTGITVSAYDNFNATTAGGNLNGRAAPAGGTWATSGAATDYQFADFGGGEQVARTTTADTGPRYAILGTTAFTNVQVSALIRASGTELGSNDTVQQGVIARWTDANNHVRLFWQQTLRSNSGRDLATSLVLEQVVGGTVTRLMENGMTDLRDEFLSVRLWVYDSGRIVGRVATAAGMELRTVEASSASVATGGPLATGRAGLYDFNNTTSMTRYYDVPTIATIPAEAVAINRGRSIQIGSSDTVRADTTGLVWGRPTSYVGSRLRLRPGNNRVVAKARRPDVDTTTDDFVQDSTQFQVAFTPRFLVVRSDAAIPND